MIYSSVISRKTVCGFFSCILAVFWAFLPVAVAAQNSASTPTWPWINQTVTESPYKYQGETIAYLGNLELSIAEFIKANYTEFKDSRTDLKLVALKTSALGWHATFYQTFMGVKIYGTEVKVNIKEENSVSSVFTTLVSTANWSNSLSQNFSKSIPNAENIIFYYNNEPLKAKLFDYHNNAENQHLKVIEAENGLTFSSNLARNLHGGPKDTTVWVYVFNPDPLTTAGVIYGGEYVNNYDKDTAVLTEERQLLPVTMRYLEDSIWAENKYVRLFSEDVNFHIPWSRTDTFDYTRSQPEFEFIMALYHITKYKEYINSLGLDSLMNYQIHVRPRAFSDDNSNFQRTSNSKGKGILRYGNSSKSVVHVDDAEDADVIVHEYGHAISYNANLNELDGAGRKAIDEGFCDYLAASYSKQLSPFRASYVYSWDGHNTFWDGRVCFTDKTCDDFNSNKTIYENGEIFASALYEINEALGPEITDKILLNSLYEYADRMDFKHAAELYIGAELELYKGNYHDTICNIFKKYAFVNEEFCKLSIGGFAENEHEIEVDKWAFAKNGEVHVVFKKEYTGSISIFSAEGKMIYNQQIGELSQFSTQINSPSGMYFIVFSDGWNIYTEKVVK